MTWLLLFTTTLNVLDMFCMYLVFEPNLVVVQRLRQSEKKHING